MTSDQKGRRILLVSPKFHGYWRAIEAALTARGHNVATHRYDEPANFTGRVGNKVLHDLPDDFTPPTLARALSKRAVNAVIDHKPEVVVIIKGDLLGQNFWDVLDKRRVPRVTWLYDEVRRTQYTESNLLTIGPWATYSPLDAKKFDVPVVADAFDHRTPFNPVIERAVTFIGARYPQREKTIRSLHESGIPVRVYGRDWSRRLSDRLRTHTLHASNLPSGPNLTRAGAYGVMSGSSATINIHGDQDGFTMRTFEASGTGGVQIIDRDDIGGYYDIGTEILTFKSTSELRDLSARCLRDPTWANAIRAQGRARTLAEHTFDHRLAILESLWD